MSFQADFHQATDVLQRIPTVDWTWEMADINRFMFHDVVPRQANQTVTVTGRSVSTDNGLNPRVTLTVTLTPVPGLINFFAIRVPPLV